MLVAQGLHNAGTDMEVEQISRGTLHGTVQGDGGLFSKPSLAG